MNGAPREVPESTHRVPRENLECPPPPRNFPRAKPKGNLEGDLQYFSEGLHEYSRDLSRGSLYHDSPKGFSHTFILMDVLDQFSCLCRYCACAGRRLLTNFLCLLDRLICLSRIDQAERFA